MAFVTDIQQPQRSMEYHSDPVKPASDYSIPAALDTVGGFIKLTGSSQGTSKVDTSDYIPNVIQRIKAYKDVNNLTDEWFREEAWQASADYAAAKGVDFSDVKKEYDAYFGASAPSVGVRAASEKGREEAIAEYAKEEEQAVQTIIGGLGVGTAEQKRALANDIMQSTKIAIANTHVYTSLIERGDTEAAQKQLNMMCIEGYDALTKALGNYLSILPEEGRVKALRNPDFIYPIVSEIYAGNPQAAKIVSDKLLETTAGFYEGRLKLSNGMLAQEKALSDNSIALMRNTELLALVKEYPLMALLDPSSITSDDINRMSNLAAALERHGTDPKKLVQNVSLPLTQKDYQTLYRLYNGNRTTLAGRNMVNDVIKNSATGKNREQAWDNATIASDIVMQTGTAQDKKYQEEINAGLYSKAALGALEESGEYSEYSDKLVITTTDGKMHVFDLEGNEVLDHPLSKFFAKNEGKVRRFQEAKQFDTLTAARNIARIVPPSVAVEAFGRINGIDFTQPMTPEEYKSFIKSDRFKTLGKLGELHRNHALNKYLLPMKEAGELVVGSSATLIAKYLEAAKGSTEPEKTTISAKLPEQTVSTSTSPLEIDEDLAEKIRNGEKLTDEDLKKVEEANKTLRDNKDYRVIDDAIELVHKIEAGQELTKDEKRKIKEAKEKAKKIMEELNNE